MGEIKSHFKETNSETSKEIKNTSNNDVSQAKDFVKSLFKEYTDIVDSLKKYFDSINDYSELDNPVKDNTFSEKDIRRPSLETMTELRKEFSHNKDRLKKEWEEKNGMEWPKYKEDVYDSNGNLIRKAGTDYDAHHIHPLSWGGKNEVSNITPLHALSHYDHRGVHAPDSAYEKISKNLRGVNS